MPEDKECLWCERGWAILGFIAGGVIMYMAVDLATSGWLTRSISRAPRLASVTDIGGRADDAG